MQAKSNSFFWITSLKCDICKYKFSKSDNLKVDIIDEYPAFNGVTG